MLFARRFRGGIADGSVTLVAELRGDDSFPLRRIRFRAVDDADPRAELAAEVERSLQQAAARSGRVLVASDARMPLLWAMVNGIGDQLVDERYRLHDCTRDEFLRFSTEAFIAALTRAAVPSPSSDAVM